MLYSQYSHRVASKVIANNCMILKNPTKVCSEKCPFTRGEKNICDWISCSWLCFIFQLIELEHNSQREHWFLTSKDPRRKVWVFLCLLVYLEESKKIWSADVDFIFKQRNCKKPVNFSSLLRVKLSHQHRYDETFPMTRMHEPRCQRNRQAA